MVEFGSQVFRKEFRFVPSEVDLLWEAVDSYTPPFYKGKALPLAQAEVRVTAIPETQLISPSDAPNLVYHWENNYQVVSNVSDFGRQSYTFETDPLSPSEKVSVTANDRRENSFAKNTLDLLFDQFNPKILFYEIDNNGRLLTQRALNTFSFVGADTIKLAFQPLFMSSQKPNFVDLYIDWNINGESTAPQDFAKQNELYITAGGESGSANIGVTTEGIERVIQKSSESIDLIFSN